MKSAPVGSAVSKVRQTNPRLPLQLDGEPHPGGDRDAPPYDAVGAQVAALHIGKAPLAVPALRQDLGLSLAFASWVIGAYAVVGAVAGLTAGMAVNFVGARRSLAIGLLVTGAASCAGALATSGRVLLLTRVVEGAGFLMVAIAAPMLLRVLTAPRDRDAIFGWWAIYFTVGSVVAMLAVSAQQVHDKVRGLSPWPGAFTYLNGEILKLASTRVVAGSGAPGTVLSLGSEGVVVACGEQALSLGALQLPGKKMLPAADFLRGTDLQVGTLLESGRAEA